KKHTKEKWIILYIQRWLTAPFQMEDGTIVERKTGTPQGGVISPALANLFLRYVFDDFMAKEFPTMPWARYTDDGTAHCVSQKQAKYLRRRLEQRFQSYGLELNQEKTRTVYCRTAN
ncbi:reverse transcriptase domain-containing protein, partial [Petralouisia muris]|uniref:reverse transcriptase domain-containing protein n=1 Tax=Petralouisia muris TaxID=3032872 RepID=UPI0023B85FEB